MTAYFTTRSPGEIEKEILVMLITKKMLLALTLIGALVGAGFGSLITHSASSTQAQNDNYQTSQPNTMANTPEQLASNRYGTVAEQAAYRQGFAEGYGVCETVANNAAINNSAPRAYASTYRAPVRRYSNRTSRAYYDYNTQPRGRSFWQKHRDKLTMAIGTGSGAAIGGLAGGKKGAGIGALIGLGGSALYTYKLRKREPRRY
jgi:hypothetical protein